MRCARSRRKTEKVLETAAKTGKTAGAAKAAKTLDLTELEKPAKPHHVKTASLADILGFNPNKGKKAPTAMIDESEVPEKFRRYYRLLLDLRHHVLVQLGEHTEETAQVVQGRLRRPFRLRPAHGRRRHRHLRPRLCAQPGFPANRRPSPRSRPPSSASTTAPTASANPRRNRSPRSACWPCPSPRYSAEAKKQVERHSHRAQQRGGLFGDGDGEEGGKIADDSGDDE
ncbi:MAG: hypothetical protein WDM96_03520 [Lacunisphaera sp.]